MSLLPNGGRYLFGFTYSNPSPQTALPLAVPGPCYSAGFILQPIYYGIMGSILTKGRQDRCLHANKLRH